MKSWNIKDREPSLSFHSHLHSICHGFLNTIYSFLLPHLHPAQFSWLECSLCSSAAEPYPSFRTMPHTACYPKLLARAAINTDPSLWPPVTSTARSAPNCICCNMVLTDLTTSRCISCLPSQALSPFQGEQSSSHTYTNTNTEFIAHCSVPDTFSVSIYALIIWEYILGGSCTIIGILIKFGCKTESLMTQPYVVYKRFNTQRHKHIES